MYVSLICVLHSLKNSSKIGRRSALHVSDGCFALFSVSMAIPSDSVYRSKFNDAILRLQENGVKQKMMRDVLWSAKKQASAGRVEAVMEEKKVKVATTPEERSLTLVDTEGMFMFLGIGYLIAVGALISEWVGGCSNRVINILKIRKQERLDREEQEEKDKHPSRRPSFLKNFGKRISLSGRSNRTNDSKNSLEPPNNSSSRNSVTSMSKLSKQTLHELYQGPKKRQPSMVFINGKMVSEDKVYAERELINGRYDTDSLGRNSTGSSNLDDDSPHSQNEPTIVEINRVPSPPVPTTTLSRRSSQLATIDEGVFGDKILY